MTQFNNCAWLIAQPDRLTLARDSPSFKGFAKLVAVARYEVRQLPVLAVARYLKVRLAPETIMASSTTLGCHGNYGKSRTHADA